MVVGDVPWMTGAQAWAFRESIGALSQFREQYEDGRGQGQGERPHNILGRWESGPQGGSEPEPDPVTLHDFLTIPAC